MWPYPLSEHFLCISEEAPAWIQRKTGWTGAPVDLTFPSRNSYGARKLISPPSAVEGLFEGFCWASGDPSDFNPPAPKPLSCRSHCGYFLCNVQCSKWVDRWWFHHPGFSSQILPCAAPAHHRGSHALLSSSPCGFAITSLSGCTGSQA